MNKAEIISWMEDLGGTPEARKKIITDLIVDKHGHRRYEISKEDRDICLQALQMIEDGEGGEIFNPPIKIEEFHENDTDEDQGVVDLQEA